jgi:hypothetical protein
MGIIFLENTDISIRVDVSMKEKEVSRSVI